MNVFFFLESALRGRVFYGNAKNIGANTTHSLQVAIETELAVVGGLRALQKSPGPNRKGVWGCGGSLLLIGGNNKRQHSAQVRQCS